MRRCAGWVVAICFTAAAAAATAATAQVDLRGVWKIVSYTRDGQPVPLEAMLIITERHFTRVLMEKGRPKFENFNFREPDKLTPEQRRIVAETYPRFNASAGTYRIEGNIFYFRSTAHHNPGAEGRESDRRFELKGDRLRMYARAGSGEVDELWERIELF